MVGKAFRVIFTRYAQRRRREIFDFEGKLNGKRYAEKVQRAIGKEAKKLEKMPEANPLYLQHDSKHEVRYTKALDYKILFAVFKKTSEVVVLTIRNDAEDPDKIKGEL
jgi:plasmid stabilization system protein ParE